MTVKEFLDKEVRPVIGDSYPMLANPQPTELQTLPPQTQIVKYPDEVLLSLMNEGLLDISLNSDFFTKQGYLLVRAGVKGTPVPTPKDFRGFYSSTATSVGTRINPYSDMPDIDLMPKGTGIVLESSLSEQSLKAYVDRFKGVALPDDIIESLISSGVIEPNANQLLVDLNGAIVKIQYKYTPAELSLTDNLTDRELIYTLKWWTASRAVTLDFNNEAVNLVSLYNKFYLARLEKAGDSTHNWNNVSVSPYYFEGY